MDRNLRHSAYSNSVGPRSLPHMMSNGGGKRHSQDGRYSSDGRHDMRHSADVRHSGDVRHDMRDMRHSDMRDMRDVRHSGDVRQMESRHGVSGARLSPPNYPTEHNNNNSSNHDDLIQYIYESWNKVTKEIEKGSEDAKYYQEVVSPRQLANFRPFNLEDWWGRRMVQGLNRQPHRS